MEIYDEIEIIDLALKYKNILIIGDVQLGYEESMSKKGYLIPKFNLDEIIKRLDKIFSKVKVEKIIIHGHKLLSDLRKIIIIGHEHPAVSFGEKKYEKYKCFLKGKFEKHTLIALPSFNFLTVGSDITKEQFLSPYLKESKIENFEVYAVEDKVYYFGEVKDLE